MTEEENANYELAYIERHVTEDAAEHLHSVGSHTEEELDEIIKSRISSQASSHRHDPNLKLTETAAEKSGGSIRSNSRASPAGSFGSLKNESPHSFNYAKTKAGLKIDPSEKSVKSRNSTRPNSTKSGSTGSVKHRSPPSGRLSRAGSNGVVSYPDLNDVKSVNSTPRHSAKSSTGSVSSVKRRSGPPNSGRPSSKAEVMELDIMDILSMNSSHPNSAKTSTGSKASIRSLTLPVTKIPTGRSGVEIPDDTNSARSSRTNSTNSAKSSSEKTLTPPLSVTPNEDLELTAVGDTVISPVPSDHGKRSNSSRFSMTSVGSRSVPVSPVSSVVNGNRSDHGSVKTAHSGRSYGSRIGSAGSTRSQVQPVSRAEIGRSGSQQQDHDGIEDQSNRSIGSVRSREAGSVKDNSARPLSQSRTLDDSETCQSHSQSSLSVLDFGKEESQEKNSIDAANQTYSEDFSVTNAGTDRHSSKTRSGDTKSPDVTEAQRPQWLKDEMMQCDVDAKTDSEYPSNKDIFLTHTGFSDLDLTEDDRAQISSSPTTKAKEETNVKSEESTSEAPPNSTSSHGGNVLIEAAERGDIGTVRHLLHSTDTNPDRKTKYQSCSALHLAASYGQYSVVKELLMAGADPGQVNVAGKSPLHEACQGGHSELLELLSGYTTNIDTQDHNGHSAAHIAAEEGEVDCLRILYVKGATLISEDMKGRQPAHLAAKRNHTNVIEFLYDTGVDLEVADKQGKLPVHLAAQFGALDCLACLIERDCDVALGDKSGNFPIHIAAAYNHLESVRFLVKQGSDKEALQGQGKTPAHMAAHNGSKEVLHWLLEKGVNPNFTDANGNTPVHFAAEAGKAECFNCLLQHDAELNIKNKREETPLDSARRFGHPVLIDRAVQNEVTCAQCVAKSEYLAWKWANRPPPVLRSVSKLKGKAYRNPLPPIQRAQTQTRIITQNNKTRSKTAGREKKDTHRFPKRDLAAKYFGEYLHDGLH